MRTVVGILCFMCVAALSLKIGGTTSDSNFTTHLEAPAAVRRGQDRGGNYERPSSCDSEQCYGCRTNNYYLIQDCPPGRDCVKIETDMFDVRMCIFDMTDRRLL
ncbi:hypothetical protein FOZ60_002148 [Perkinsus olseni]|uniref:Uncharacterized protein n=1 Tax=Perkinsus olseni TaxID=32597 RepID=A0A7J6NZN9_PEROL|nr:hypothetical protein FOZ60_002148 [Perkinsus olseni]